MKKYRVESWVKVQVATIIDAKSEKEAGSIASDRLANGDVIICIHGSEFTDGENEEVFVLTDGDVTDHGDIENIEEK